MATRALEVDPVLAALVSAPRAELTPQEVAALAEVEGEPPAWLATDEILAALPPDPSVPAKPRP